MSLTVGGGTNWPLKYERLAAQVADLERQLSEAQQANRSKELRINELELLEHQNAMLREALQKAADKFCVNGITTCIVKEVPNCLPEEMCWMHRTLGMNITGLSDEKVDEIVPSRTAK